MIKGAIFDFDGTLFDSMFVWDTVGEIYLRSVGREPKENLRQVLKTMSLYQSSSYFKEHYNISLTVPEIMEGISKTVEDFYLHSALPKPGVSAFLEEMYEHGVNMCIATAIDKYQVEFALERCHMAQFFSEIFTCNDVGHGKDEPIIFREAMQYLQTDRTNTVVFEDAYHAIQTAASDGFLTVAVYDAHEKNEKEIQEVSNLYMRNFFDTKNFWKFASKI